MARCKKCNKSGLLSRHSKLGNHQPPFILLCRDCHDKVHGTQNKRTNIKTQRGNLKFIKGTDRRKLK